MTIIPRTYLGLAAAMVAGATLATIALQTQTKTTLTSQVADIEGWTDGYEPPPTTHDIRWRVTIGHHRTEAEQVYDNTDRVCYQTGDMADAFDVVFGMMFNAEERYERCRYGDAVVDEWKRNPVHGFKDIP